MEKLDKIITKDEFLRGLRSNMEDITGLSLSLEKVWDIFRLCAVYPYELANSQNAKVTLMGVGLYRMYKTPQGNLSLKFYGSETVKKLLSKNGTASDLVKYAQVFRNTKVFEEFDGTNAEELAKKANALLLSTTMGNRVAKKAEPKKETKKVEEPKKEEKPKNKIVQEPKKAEEPKKVEPKKSSVPKKAEAEKEMLDDLLDDDLFASFEL